MAVAYVTLKGEIKGGKLTVELPENAIDGEVEVRIPVAEDSLEEALPDYLHFEGKTLGEILESDAIGSWGDMGIEDSVEWVEEQRRKMWEERKSRWMDS